MQKKIHLAQKNPAQWNMLFIKSGNKASLWYVSGEQINPRSGVLKVLEGL